MSSFNKMSKFIIFNLYTLGYLLLMVSNESGLHCYVKHDDRNLHHRTLSRPPVIRDDQSRTTASSNKQVDQPSVPTRFNAENITSDITNCTSKRLVILEQQLQHQKSFLLGTAPSILEESSHVDKRTGLSEQEFLTEGYIPQCTEDGLYQAMQCQGTIRYCWCVDYKGKPIMGTSSPDTRKPDCSQVQRNPPRESTYPKISPLLSQSGRGNGKKYSGRPATSPSDRLDSSPEKASSIDMSSAANHSSVPSSSHEYSTSSGSATSQTSLNSQPNDCSSSRSRALEQSNKYPDSGIWVPECDEEGKLYSELQWNHDGSICWCVDTTTGFPLKSNQNFISPVSKSDPNSRPNCAAARAAVSSDEQSTSLSSIDSSSVDLFENHSNANYQGPKRTNNGHQCVGYSRQVFLRSLLNSFQDELKGRIRVNETLRKELLFSTNTNNHHASKIQIIKWKFQSLDKNLDNQLDDSEWSKFRGLIKIALTNGQQKNLKDLLHQQMQQQLSSLLSISKSSQSDSKLAGGINVQLQYIKPVPVVLLQSERRCWTEFLESCENLKADEQLITMNKWLECTEIISTNSNHRPSSSHQANSVTSNEAYINRRRNKNPFLSILKSD